MGGSIVFNKEANLKRLVLTGKNTLPASETITGTMLSTGFWVRGIGTKFTTELRKDEYLYNGDVLRRIQFIVSDTLLRLTDAFPADITIAIAVKRPSLTRYRNALFKNTGATAATVNESTLTSGSTKEYEHVGGIAPISYDAAITTLEVEVKF